MRNKPNMVYLVDGLRTPYLTSDNPPHKTSSEDLITSLSRQLLLRQPFLSSDLDAIFVASSSPLQSGNLAKKLALRLHTDAAPHYITANGALTGQLSVSEAMHKISHQKQQLVLIAGVDRFQLPKLETTNLASSKPMGSLLKKMQPVQSMVGQITKDKNRHAIDTKLREHAEKLAMQHVITPDQMSEYAQLSRRRLQYAQRNNLLKMIAPLYYPDASMQKSDQGVSNHANSYYKDDLQLLSEDALPVNANGASCMLIASESAVQRYKLPVIATLIDSNLCTTHTPDDDAYPNSAVSELLKKHKQSMKAIDFWEYHESSATDILIAKQQAQNSPFSTMKNVNIDGGSLALGAAPCANALGEIVQLAHILQRKQANYGIATASSTEQHSFAVLLKACKDNSDE